MRGLNDRIAMAYERVLEAVDMRCGNEVKGVDVDSLFQRAQKLGFADYFSDRRLPMPSLYVDEPVLENGWKSGQLAAADLEETEFAEAQLLKLDGHTVCRLMHEHQITIADLATKWNLTQKHVCQVRAEGVTGYLASEWHYLITGQWLDQIATNQ